MSTRPSPFEIPNVRLFIAFRMFFNARFYYPIFTILFLDFGITIQQFALLNVVWAVTIVLCEVPSGALADIVGRKKMVVIAGILMVIEMAFLCFAPRGNPDLLFLFFLANRILSGIAEASASGADEAIAYDSLKQEGDSRDWAQVLERQVRYQAIIYIVSMTIGAAVYDPDLMQALCVRLHLPVTVTRDVTLRFPLYLTLIMAVLTLLTALAMREDDSTVSGQMDCRPWSGCYRSLADAFQLTFTAGAWIARTGVALVLIGAGMLFDHVIRMFITLGSQYYRMIALPDASFGLVGSGLAVLGVILPRYARFLVGKNTPSQNFLIVALLALLGMAGIPFVLPYFGLIPVVLMIAAMYLSSFFLSHYLNSITSSQQRATVLSFKGLSFNLAYGLIGVGYSLLLAVLRPDVLRQYPRAAAAFIENHLFVESLQWFPVYYLILLGLFVLFARLRLRNVPAGWWQNTTESIPR